MSRSMLAALLCILVCGCQYHAEAETTQHSRVTSSASRTLRDLAKNQHRYGQPQVLSAVKVVIGDHAQQAKDTLRSELLNETWTWFRRAGRPFAKPYNGGFGTPGKKYFVRYQSPTSGHWSPGDRVYLAVDMPKVLRLQLGPYNNGDRARAILRPLGTSYTVVWRNLQGHDVTNQVNAGSRDNDHVVAQNPMPGGLPATGGIISITVSGGTGGGIR